MEAGKLVTAAGGVKPLAAILTVTAVGAVLVALVCLAITVKYGEQ